MSEEPSVEVRCPKCGSTMTYLRLLKKEMVCRKCGHTGPPEEFKSEKPEGAK